MGNWIKQQEEIKEQKERNNVRKEKLAEFYFSLSNTLFGSLVIGIVLMLINEDLSFSTPLPWIVMGCGSFMLIGLAKIGNNILK